MSERTLRGKAAVVGIAETKYYKLGKSPDPEFKLGLMAVLAACQDAGIAPRDIDGFASYCNDRNEPPRLAAALGCKRAQLLEHAVGRRRGRRLGAVANAAAAIATGQADCVVVYPGAGPGPVRALRAGPPMKTVSGAAAHTLPFGLMSPAQMFAMKVNRFMHDHGVQQEALRAIALAVLPPRPEQPARRHVRPAARRRHLRRLALDRRAVPPLRLLPGERRRRRLLLVPAERAKRLPAAAGLCAWRGAGLGHRRGRCRAQRARYGTSQLHDGGAAPLRHGAASSRRTSTWCSATRTSRAAC